MAAHYHGTGREPRTMLFAARIRRSPNIGVRWAVMRRIREIGMNVGRGPLPAMWRAQSGLVALSLALILFSQPAISSPPEFESPPEARAADVLGPAATGPNYHVLDPVTGDGLLRIYRIKSTYGTFTVAGDAMLLQRRKELAAISVLDRQSRTG